MQRYKIIEMRLDGPADRITFCKRRSVPLPLRLSCRQVRQVTKINLMANLNLYESPVGFQPERPEISSRSSRKWAIIGFLVGAVIPIVWGIYVLRALRFSF